MKPHTLSIYYRQGVLYIQPSLPSRRGIIPLESVIVAEGGWSGLRAALMEGERIALLEAQKQPGKRHYADDSTLARAAGCRNFREFIPGTVQCTFNRVPDYVLVVRSLPNLELGAMVGTPRQDELPPDSTLDRLALVARDVIEGKNGW
ncbi:MAG TPA: hypothetical protein PLX89_18900 [Verrucomicrobiota bacterium]|nr:hypothetical protein [Verrucomicrobiales bacterium]HRI15069.1 hypothetical protein [Verrucomicrobiota bacterium]